jgi:hypothetical protein
MPSSPAGSGLLMSMERATGRGGVLSCDVEASHARCWSLRGSSNNPARWERFHCPSMRVARLASSWPYSQST